MSALLIEASINDLGRNRVEQYPKPGEATPRPPKPLTLWAPSRFFEFKPNPSDMLLGDGFVERGEWTSLVGIGGLGKTRLALWFCICQITGREWCGIKTAVEPQKCLLLSTESGLRRWKIDLEKMFATLTQAERELVETYLRLLALTPDEEGDLNLGESGNVARLTATLRAENPGIIVFDPFADMVNGDENSTVDLIATLRALRGIHHAASPTAAFIVIHHARTGSSNVAQAGDNYSAGNFGRGSKALYSRVRCELQLAPGDRDNSNLMVLACGKANNTEKFKPRGIVFDPDTFTYSVDPSFDLQAWRSDVAGKRGNKTVSVTDVVTAVESQCPHGGDTAQAGAICKAVNAATGASVRTIKDRISEAVKTGYLGKVRHGVYSRGAQPLKT